MCLCRIDRRAELSSACLAERRCLCISAVPVNNGQLPGGKLAKEQHKAHLVAMQWSIETSSDASEL